MPIPVLTPQQQIAIANERRKITATALNNIAVASFVAGIVAPLAAISYAGTNAESASDPWYYLKFGLIAVSWLIATFSFHGVARAVLKGLR